MRGGRDRRVRFARASGLALLLVAAAAAPTAVLAATRDRAPGSSRPLGRVLWTQRSGDEFSLEHHLYLPEGHPGELAESGTVRVNDQGLLSPEGRELRAGGAVGTAGPASTLRFLHPRLDGTGRRLVYGEGETWGPDVVPAGAVPNPTPATRLRRGGIGLRLGLSDKVLTAPSRDGGEMDASPAFDPMGRFVIFSRFYYRDDPGGAPGWFLARRELGKKDGTVELLRDSGGRPVAGRDPVIGVTGTHLVFVRSDPANVGSDLYAMSLDPPGDPYLLVPGEGPYPAPGPGEAPYEAWAAYSSMGGKARLSRPSLSPDLGWVAYASDRDGDWDLYLAPLEEDGAGQLRAGDEIPVMPGAVRPPDPVTALPGTGGDEADDSWPSFSGDGRFLAYMSDRVDASETAARGEQSRIWVVGLEATGGPAGVHEVVPGADGGGEHLWPHWDQDEDPPHLLVILSPDGGGEPFELKLADQEPDASARSDVVSMTLRMRDHHPAMPPPGAPTPAALAPLDLGPRGREPAVQLEYPVGPGVGNGLSLLLSGRQERLGEHRGLGQLKRPSGRLGKAGTQAFEHPVLTSQDFDGLYTFTKVRLEVDVLARDDRWRRVGVPRELAGQLYPGGAVPPDRVEVTQLLRGDPRRLDPWAPRAPYLPLVSRDAVLERQLPGMAWWVEELAHGDAEGVVLQVRDENAPALLFRAPNFPPERYPQSRAMVLRVVARDLLGNATDVRIPLHVRSKDMEVDVLSRQAERGTL